MYYLYSSTNMNKNSYYKYGIEYKKSELIFDDISAEIKNAYNPFESCASAQIFIKREVVKK